MCNPQVSSQISSSLASFFNWYADCSTIGKTFGLENPVGVIGVLILLLIGIRIIMFFMINSFGGSNAR